MAQGTALAGCGASACRRAAWLLAGACLSGAAQSQETPFLLLRAAAASHWDSNLFRLPDSAPDPQAAAGRPGKDDRYTVVQLGATLEKSYASQRLSLDVAHRALRYDKFESLDRNELDYRGEWRFQVGSRVSGSLTSSRSESLIAFDETQVQARNVTVSTTHALAADAWVTGGWYVLAGASETRRRNSELFLAQPDSRQVGANTGIRYVSHAGNSLAYVRRASRGDNTGAAVGTATRIDSEFSVDEDTFSIGWARGGAHALSGRLSRIRYDYTNFPERSFSANAADISDTWSVTSALTLVLTAGRSAASWTIGTASYRVDDTVSIAPTWRITDKTSMLLRAHRTTTSFRGAPAGTADESRRDLMEGLRLGVTWLPLDRARISATLGRDSRSSSDPLSDYRADTLVLEASLAF